MSKYFDYIGVEKIIQDYIDRTGYDGVIQEELFYIFTEEALDQIIPGDVYTDYVVLLNLYNYKAELPKNFIYPNQIAYRSYFEDCTPQDDIKRYFINSLQKDYNAVVVDACYKCKQESCACDTKEWYPIRLNQDYVTLSNKPELALGYSKFMRSYTDNYVDEAVVIDTPYLDPNNSEHLKYLRNIKKVHPFSRSNICPEFQMVRPTSNYLFNLPGRVKACNIPSYDTNLEYNIKEKIIEINNYKAFTCKHGCATEEMCYHKYDPDPDGQVLVSYMGRKVDENGFLMIPNEPYVIKAVAATVNEQLAYRRYSITLEQKHERYWGNAANIALKARKQAKSRLRMPSFDIWEQFIDNHWLKKIPYKNYKKFNNATMPDQYRLPNQTLMDNRDTVYPNQYRLHY